MKIRRVCHQLSRCNSVQRYGVVWVHDNYRPRVGVVSMTENFSNSIDGKERLAECDAIVKSVVSWPAD